MGKLTGLFWRMVQESTSDELAGTEEIAAAQKAVVAGRPVV